jgi:hypothetical protein
MADPETEVDPAYRRIFVTHKVKDKTMKTTKNIIDIELAPPEPFTQTVRNPSTGALTTEHDMPESFVGAQHAVPDYTLDTKE